MYVGTVAVEDRDADDDDEDTSSGSSDSGRWSHSEGVVHGAAGKPHVTVLGRSSKRRRRRDAAGGKSAPASFRSSRDRTVATGGQSGSGGVQVTGTRTVANGLKMAQTQAIAVTGFLTEVNPRQWRVCASCLSHRASYHGRGD